MKKIISKVSLLSVLVFGVMNAEESGIFIGAGLGYGGTNMEATLKGSNIRTNVGGFVTGTSRYEGGGFAFGIMGGYKQFFTQHLGLRYYANVDMIVGKVEPNYNAKNTFGSSDRELNLVNYGVNVDFLANFISNETLDFGAFVGLGLGGSSWFGKGLDDLQTFIDTALAGSAHNIELQKTGFDVALNIGLRANIAKHHGIEVAARVPFLKTTILDYDIGSANETMTTHNPYRITVRYAFSF